MNNFNYDLYVIGNDSVIHSAQNSFLSILDLETISNSARNFFLENDLVKMEAELRLIPEINYEWIKDELVFGTGNSNFFRYFKDKNPDFIIGIFECPYNLNLKFEYTKIKEVAPTIIINSKYNNVRCVKQLMATEGIGDEQIVAIFPENFRSIVPDEEDPIFYFVDKFTKRHLKYTRPILISNQIELFSPIINLDEKRIENLVTNWVLLHETSHRKGAMPIPKYLFEKSNKYTAALEELRADLIAVSSCFSKDENFISDDYITGLFILAERLVAYPAIRHKNNFDTISSIFLWKFLDEKNAFCKNLNISNIFGLINELIALIEKFEERSLLQPDKYLRKRELQLSILEYIGDYNEEYENYLKHWRDGWIKQ